METGKMLEVFNATGLNPKLRMEPIRLAIDGETVVLRPGAMITVEQLTGQMQRLIKLGWLLVRPHGSWVGWRALMFGIKDYEIPEDAPTRRIDSRSSPVVRSAAAEVIDPSKLVQKPTSLLEIDGIDLKKARMLKRAGIESLDDLASVTKSSGVEVARKTKTNVETLKAWVLSARNLLKESE